MRRDRGGRYDGRRRTWPGGDAGDIVLGWLTKMVVVFALIGLVGFDGISIAVAHVTVVDDAQTAGEAASTAWQTAPKTVGPQQRLQLAYNAAGDAISSDEDIETTSFSADADGTIHLTVIKKARTMLIYRISPFRKLGVIRETRAVKAVAP